MSAPAARLTAVLGPVLAQQGVDLEDLAVSPAGRRQVVRVLVDRDGGITLDDVAELSRLLSEALDALDAAEPGVLGDAYVLEVSSPGVDRPLTAPRHWRRNVGRLVQVHRRGDPPLTGRVLAADDDSVTLDVDGTERVLPLADVDAGSVQVEFSRPGGEADDAVPGPDATEDDATEDGETDDDAEGDR